MKLPFIDLKFSKNKAMVEHFQSLKRNRAEFDRETNCLVRILKYVTR